MAVRQNLSTKLYCLDRILKTPIFGGYLNLTSLIAMQNWFELTTQVSNAKRRIPGRQYSLFGRLPGSTSRFA